MKVYFIQPDFPVYRNGLVRRLTEHFSGNIHLISYSYEQYPRKNEFPKPDFDINYLVRIFYLGIPIIRGLSKLSICKNDVVILPSTIRELSLIYFSFICRLKGARLCYLGHYKGKTGFLIGLVRLFYTASMGHAVVFYTQSELSKSRWFSRAFRNTLFASFDNTIDTSIIDAYQVPYVAQNREASIVFLGRPTIKSNFLLLVKAVRLLKQPIKIYLIGVTREELTYQCESENSTFECVGYLRSESEIATILNKSRLFVYPGDVGLSIIHGAAYGLPFIVHSSESDHMPESDFAFRFRGGCFFSRNDESSLAHCIDSYINSYDLLNTHSSVNRSAIKDCYSIENSFSKLLGVINYLSPSD